MLTSIQFGLPDATPDQRAFNTVFFELLNLDNFGPSKETSVLRSYSKDLFPAIRITRVQETTLTVTFHKETEVLSRLAFMHPKHPEARKPRHVPALLSLVEFAEIFKGSLVSLNHVGINFYTSFMNKPTYSAFKQQLAQESNLYNYPTGEEWPFIIPATQEEHTTEITDFSLKRNPEFEFVYSRYEPVPCIQCDFETSLTKEEVFQRLPKPAGISFEGLEDYMRTVYIAHPWGDGLLRFDVRFKDNGPAIYPWIVEKGGRVRYSSIIFK